MAEAAAVQDAPGPPRFYCHVCKQEFTDITQEYTCPVCSDGFIEELHDTDPSPAGGAAGNTMEVDVLELLNTGFRDGLAADGRAGGGYRGQPSTGRSWRRPTGRHHHHHHHHHPRMGPPNHPTGDGGPAPAMINAYDQLIRDFFAYVGVPAGGGVVPSGAGGIAGGGGAAGANGRRLITAGAPMFFVANPGDYVWGHDGLDSVITLMLNQFEPTGPPPMSAQKIDEIPKCDIGQEELDKKMQCSVCLEDFELKEQCRKLPCAHIFHETCILPWLELHGTCPICRDTFTEAQADDENNQDDEAMETDAGANAMPSTGTSANSFESFLSGIQRPGGVMDVLASHLPRTVSSSSGGGGAGVIGSGPIGSVNSSSASATPQNVSNSNTSSNNRSSSQSATTTTNTTNEANVNVPPRNNLNFHLDDGLD